MTLAPFEGADALVRRNNISSQGPEGAPAIVFGHGYGSSRQMWRLVAPQFVDDHRVVLFDHVGSGGSDRRAYDRGKYDSLHGYADDLLEICHALGLSEIVYVGHSVGAMIGCLAAIAEPTLFDSLVLVGGSARYINDEGYVGGFEADDVDALLDSLDANYLAWASTMAPVFMGNSDRPELTAELLDSFSKADQAVARQFARVTFLSDLRSDLSSVSTPTLVVQSTNDIVAPVVAGEFLRDSIPGSRLEVLEAEGHYVHVSDPEKLTTTIRSFLG
ncbi:alpha/beta fold hydrolase [Subtercola boreus]|uniref:Alpha/beta hydrolase n=1 Tax=Subtercola boreus TaxID=120213 RepID=A0A3E0WCC6_9MICO|nr:alpha/beta hydrolase [Subtercola boreus]RFA20060.1 alpha/beta hydrolase [Subtercola boreus]RFA20190.1 alpha/beta hydrolase [Subtercola boreus]RFA26516.1 alpha/beta hydrolase [Subtercola boreus]